MRKPIHYLNNPALKAAGVQLQYTQLQLQEYAKCAADPIYFIENYVKIISLDKGAVLAKLFPYQKRIISAIHNNRQVVSKLFRQSGKSTVIACYIAWYITFNDLKTVAILANKATIAQEIFNRVQFIYENLPMWLQQGVKEWNKTSLWLENGARCFSAASSPSAIRGMSVNFLLCDEFAHLAPNLADEFIASVFPTLSSSQESKLVLVSTPKGFNAFAKIWKEAEEGLNGFVAVTGTWDENPYRTQEWADKMRVTLGEVKYAQEISCDFVGSSFSLVSGHKLTTIHTVNPILVKDKLKFYAEPKQRHSYCITVDTSRGQHLDYSAFTVLDITERPYQVVATFKDNGISPESYPFLIYTIAKQFNMAHVLIEVNDLGQAVSSALFYEFEYENVYFTHKEELNEGRGYPGVRTTKKVKSIGCSTLKSLIEQDQLVINGHEILEELGIFVQKGASYAADDEHINDDLMTCLWLFAWLTKQPIFAELTSTNIRAVLANQMERYIEENMMPYGGRSDGLEDLDAARDPYALDLSKFGGTDDPFLKWVFS